MCQTSTHASDLRSAVASPGKPALASQTQSDSTLMPAHSTQNVPPQSRSLLPLHCLVQRLDQGLSLPSNASSTEKGSTSIFVLHCNLHTYHRCKKKKKNGDEARKKAKSHEKKTFFETIRTGNQWCGGEGGKERGEERERDSSTRHSL